MQPGRGKATRYWRSHIGTDATLCVVISIGIIVQLVAGFDRSAGTAMMVQK